MSDFGDDDDEGHDVTLIAGAAGAWQRGFEAGRKSGATYAALVWGVVGFILGMITYGVLK